MGGTLKQSANAIATEFLGRLGYSDGRIREAKREGWWWLLARIGGIGRLNGVVTCSAVAWTDIGRAELLDLDVPQPGSGEVLVEVDASVVSSGTERAQYLRLPHAQVDLPYRPGYSAAGRVVGVGRGVATIAPGMCVAVRGQPHASLVTAPVESVFRVPSGVPVEQAALVELGVIASQGVRRAGLVPGEPVTVVGAGIVGALAQRIARAAGAGPITVIATSRRREASAFDAGASRFLVAGEDDTAIAAVDAPVVIEATGDPTAVATSINAVGHQGRVVLLGSSRGTTPDLDTTALRTRGITLVGAHVITIAAEARRDGRGEPEAVASLAEAFLSQIASGGLHVEDLIGHPIDPREVDALYRSLARDQYAVAPILDWAKLPPKLRRRPASVFAPPRLRARGVDPKHPLRDRSAPPEPDRRRVRRGSPLRLGILGCGDIAIQNAAAAAAAPNVRLIACFDPVHSLADDLSRAHAAVVSASAEELVHRSDVDAVFISAPHHLHEPLARLAAEAGKHVILEKPLAQSLDQAAAIVALARASGVVLSVCFPHRYDPVVRAARRLVAGGALGEIIGTRTILLADKPPSYWLGGFTGRSQSTWRSSRELAGGGVLIMNLSHSIDLLRYVIGLEAIELAAFASGFDAPGDIEASIAATVRYANGACGLLQGVSAARGFSAPEAELRAWGTAGHLVVEPSPSFYTVNAVEGTRPGRWQSLGPFAAENARATYLERLAEAIAEGREPDVTGDDGLVVQAFIEAAYRSAESGEVVRPDDLLAEPT